MFNFFSKNNSKTDEPVKDIKDDEVDDDTLDIEENNYTIDDILGEPKDIFDDYEEYRVDARLFLQFMENDWEFNRNINENHINQLYMFADKLTGYINLVRCKHDNDKILLIDGQHRREAIRRKLEDDTKLNFDIRIEIKNVYSEEDIINYFTNINNILPMDVNDIPTIKYKNVVDALYSDFPKAFRNDNSPRPYTSKKKLLLLLKSNKLFENFNISDKDLYKKIKYHNSLKSTRINISDYPKQSLDKAKITGFYLLLDNKNRWIETIKNGLASIKIDKNVEEKKERTIKLKIKKLN